MKRRDLLKNGAFAATLPYALNSTLSAAKSDSGSQSHNNSPIGKPGFLHWLEGNPPTLNIGTTWGYPWQQGELKPGQPLQINNEAGHAIPMQTWPTAYWPDGSIKWTAHAVAKESQLGQHFKIEKTKGPSPKNTVSIQTIKHGYYIDTGIFNCVIPIQGSHLITEIRRNSNPSKNGSPPYDKLIANNVKLVGLRQDKPENEPDNPATTEHFESQIKATTIEQKGPVRATVKIDGVHRTSNLREWLPFSLRLFFYAGSDALRISHTFIYDGDDQKDFIKGLGLRFDVELRDELYDRHVRFIGENEGLWAESPKGITGLRRDPNSNVRAAQIAGIKTPPLQQWDKRVSERLHWIPAWNDYTLAQPNAHGFSIKKRTKAGHAWIDADQGQRAGGSAYVGGVSGGVLFGMRDFWQMHPAQIDIRNAATDTAQATLWYWSPESPAMDVRFYHDGLGQETYEQQLDALNITYEDYEPEFGTALGVARTTDFTLHILDKTPTREHTLQCTQAMQKPAQIIATPEYYLSTQVFGGLWSLPDYSTEFKSKIETRLHWLEQFYKTQVDQRNWYGFWNYGDIMHTYDEDRHVWRYDVGGYAWDNSELSPDLWLWYSFLRSGSVDSFRLAEAMTRHNRDVDIYHLGRFKGLGSRHNVQHWGCSAKQMRISSAAYRRFHYYLTGDERTGDVLTEVVQADEQLAKLIPTRKLTNKKPVPGDARIGVGTDWGSAAANWLTAWERTGDIKYKNWLTNAMHTIAEQPEGFFTGVFGFDTKTKQLLPPKDTSATISHLSAVFGLIEICVELNQLIDLPKFKAAWIRYGIFYNATAAEQIAEFGKPLRGHNLRVAHSRITAYAASQSNNKGLAKRAWQEFQQERGKQQALTTTQVSGPQVLNTIDEAPWVSTNDAAQWSLAAIQNLALIGDNAPE